jgi:hypothetical protein
MSEHKSHKIRIEHIPQAKTRCSISSKKKSNMVLIWIMVFLVLLTKIVIAIGIVTIYALIYCFGTDKKSFEGFDNFFVIYNDKNNEFADLIYISEIEGWEYRITNNGDKVMLYLNNNEKYRIDENVDRQMYSYFRDIMPEREIRKKKER